MLVQATCRSFSIPSSSKNITTILLIALVMDKLTTSYSTEPLPLHPIHPSVFMEGVSLVASLGLLRKSAEKEELKECAM